MAELNFGLLTPPGSQSIGNAFAQGMDQAAVARAQENQNALSQYTLSKAKREDELTNRMLAGLQGADTLEKQAAVLRSVGKVKEANELLTSGLTQRKTEGEIVAAQTKLIDDKFKQSRGMLENVTTPEQYIAWHEANHADPVLGKFLASRGVTVEQSRARINAALQQPGGLERLINESKLGVEKFAEMSKPQNVQQALGSTVQTLSIPGMGGPATVVPGSTANVTAAPRLLTPEEEAQKVRIAGASRPPVQPVAPTITQIVDPTDSTKMITIDARRYAGGGAGSPGVIGVSGKEPSAALRENKIEAGKTLLADEVSNLRAALNTLNVARAIPSTERGTLSNIASSIAASGVGQVAGRIGGTQAQTERDVIASSKLRLVNAIKQATGMSAQQLNSNVELQTMLKSLSDPSQSIEANIRNLDNIEKSYINATPTAMPRAPTGAPATNIDALLKKYQ